MHHRKTGGRCMDTAKLLVFASGSLEGGGSGFENLVHSMGTGILDATIVAVVSNYEHGGVRKRADKLGIPFIHFPKPWTAERYQLIAQDSGAQFFALSGWLKRVIGLDPCFTFNIHPGPLPEFGGHGMYGHHVHEAVMAAFSHGEITHPAVCMHFATSQYDEGPIFFRFNIIIHEDDTPDSLGARVNVLEHRWQPEITNLVVHREIQWDGENPNSLILPARYEIEHWEE